jgi:hypothetical protein
MGFVLLVAGALIVVLTALAYASPTLRRLETTLPDYAAQPESEPAASPTAPQVERPDRPTTAPESG